MEIASQIATSVSARYPSIKSKVDEDVVSPNNHATRTETEHEAKEKALGVNRVKEPSEAQDSDALKDPQSEESKQLNELKARDREVRTHEQAHMAAAGGHANGGASFTYEKGPDGKQYAVGGEVQIDTSVVSGDPQATLEKAETIQRAALAPAEPSSQDRAVASEAAMMAAEARREISESESEDFSASSEQYKPTDKVDGDSTPKPANASEQLIAENKKAASNLDQKINDTGANLQTSEIQEENALSVFA